MQSCRLLYNIMKFRDLQTSTNTTSQINIIRNTTVFIRKRVNTLVGSKPLFTCIGHGKQHMFDSDLKQIFP